jgi:tetratricopeptide (TPR) repeat protein
LTSSRLTLLFILGTAVVVLAWLWWICTFDPAIPFLTRRAPAEWIVYPSPADLMTRPGVELACEFRRSFSLPSVPAVARLRIRAFRHGEITVNGTPIPCPIAFDRNWKQVEVCDVAAALRAGENHIVVTVANRFGPPALWLALTLGEQSVHTDDQWQASLAGAVWQPARPATEQCDPSLTLPIGWTKHDYWPEQSPAALRACGGTLLLLAIAATVVSAAVGWYRGSGAPAHAAARAGRHWLPALVLLTVAVSWIALVGNNASRLHRAAGFDAVAHFDYIQYILDYRRLPLADQGWEMYQPPLYHLTAALWLALLGHATHDVQAVPWLRVLGLATGLAQLGLVYASLRLLFADRSQRQFAGLGLAAFLPAHLYLFQYVSNEPLAGTLATGVVYLTLQALRREPPCVGWHIAVGVCLGAALLAKYTTVVLVPIVLVVRAARLLARGRRDPRTWLATLGVVVVTVAGVSGWHFWRVWRHFGNPMMATWDPATGFVWWQDPGYRTAGYYSAFGQSLTAPFFSGLSTFGDGWYSTLWGDGLYGGSVSLQFRPAWNYDLMAAGYVLALAPMVVLVAGAAATLVELVRRPRAEWFLLVGLGAGTVLGVGYLGLKLPYVCAVKAFYAMPAMVTLCVFGAVGFDCLAGDSRWRRAVLSIALGTWALNAYASFWVRGGSAETHAMMGHDALREAAYGRAAAHYRRALQLDAKNANARRGLAGVLYRTGRAGESLVEYERLLRDHPNDGEGHLGRALRLAESGRLDESIRQVQTAVELVPNHRTAHGVLGQLMVHKGQWAAAVDAYRQALRVTPASESAAAELAWLLATAPDEAVRAGPEAVRLGEQAARVARAASPRTLDALAAAYAEAGRFDDAIRTVRQAREAALQAGAADLADALQRRGELYGSRRPFRCAAP